MREAIAKLLWERFAPEHQVEFEDSTHRDEYRRIADEIMALVEADHIPSSGASAPQSPTADH